MAIRVENLGKRYRLGRRQEAYGTLRDTIASAAQMPWRLLRERGRADKPAQIWALQDVSFEVRQGEVLGIIGRNGAGKSTLLKILARVTQPTTGLAEVCGRTGSLLEVGTGFHPELTGRENIFLNGAVLGMKKTEIRRKFDEIVAFAEIEQFLDTPVKRYSSGMYMRLAFAVAAHLEPEILVVDEVLAVGDAAFQKKCLGKMEKVAAGGRTVLFVSHNMVAVEDLCDRALWLHDGRIKAEGPVGKTVAEYLQYSLTTTVSRIWHDMALAPGNDIFRLHAATVRPSTGPPESPITVRTPFTLEFTYWTLQPDLCLNVNLQLFNEQRVLLFEAGPVREPIWRPLPVGLHRDTCHIPGDLLNDGRYTVVLHALTNQGGAAYTISDLLVFDVQDTSDMRDGWYGEWGGVVRPILEWERVIGR
jgi:lipopolysaccharide transport system ATP-binding protein